MILGYAFANKNHVPPGIIEIVKVSNVVEVLVVFYLLNENCDFYRFTTVVKTQLANAKSHQ